MKNNNLAEWLQDHVEMLGSIDHERDNPFHVALYESIIDMVLNGETTMLDSVLESAATHAVAVGRGLTHLLGVPQRLRERIWERIGEEIDPEPAFMMLTDVDTVFVHVIRVIIDAYQEASNIAHAAKAAEISRLYTESEQKVMEYAAEVARANRELARLEQAKTDFINIAAHELKTPLTLIQGYVDMLREINSEGNVYEVVDQLTDGISRGTARMNLILEDMLDLSAIDTHQLNLVVEPVNLKRVIELVIVQYEETLAERKQTIREVNLEALPVIEGDTRRLFQTFKQVINNAIKYTPDGGQILIKGHFTAKTESKPAHVQVSVHDSGVGIAPEDHQRIFEKFYRVGDSDLHSTSATKFMGAGPGLGLAIAKGLVEAHGGNIWAESQGFDMQNFPGSIFTVALPVKIDPPPGIRLDRLTPPYSEDASPEPAESVKETGE